MSFSATWTFTAAAIAFSTFYIFSLHSPRYTYIPHRLRNSYRPFLILLISGKLYSLPPCVPLLVARNFLSFLFLSRTAPSSCAAASRRCLGDARSVARAQKRKKERIVAHSAKTRKEDMYAKCFGNFHFFVIIQYENGLFVAAVIIMRGSREATTTMYILYTRGILYILRGMVSIF